MRFTRIKKTNFDFKNKISNKKGFYFTLDALFALILLLVVIVLLPYTHTPQIEQKYKLSYLQEDALNSLSTIKASDVNNIHIKNIIENETYNNTLSPDDTLLEVISKLWVAGYKQDARNISGEFFKGVFSEEDNFALVIRNGTEPEFVFLVNNTPYNDATDIVVSKQFLSGIGQGQILKGTGARAILQRKENEKYAYFGGYVGDGNVSMRIDLPSGFTKATKLYIEAVLTRPVSIWIRNSMHPDGICVLDYWPKTQNDLTPSKIFFDSEENFTITYIDQNNNEINENVSYPGIPSLFQTGTNYIDFKDPGCPEVEGWGEPRESDFDFQVIAQLACMEDGFNCFLLNPNQENYQSIFANALKGRGVIIKNKEGSTGYPSGLRTKAKIIRLIDNTEVYNRYEDIQSPNPGNIKCAWFQTTFTFPNSGDYLYNNYIQYQNYPDSNPLNDNLKTILRHSTTSFSYPQGMSADKICKNGPDSQFCRIKNARIIPWCDGQNGKRINCSTGENITLIVNLSNACTNVKKIIMQASDILYSNLGNCNFNMTVNNPILVNGEYIGNWTITNDIYNTCKEKTVDVFSAEIYNISEILSAMLGYFGSFSFGEDYLGPGEIPNLSGFGGGYIKVNYKSRYQEYNSSKIKYLPEIKGVINLYDSIYAPNTIKSMSAKIHYNVNVPERQNTTFFFRIGNATIFEINKSGSYENNSIFNNATLFNKLQAAGLSYSDISNKTVPIRLGFKGLNRTGGNADVVLITDLSRTMNSTMYNDSIQGNRSRDCNDPNLYNNDTARINLARCLDREFVNKILSVPGNRIALVGFFGESAQSNPQARKGLVNRTTSNDDGVLNRWITDISEARNLIDVYTSGSIRYDKNSINYIPYGGGCLCCALNSAYKILKDKSNSSRKQFVVAMSDGLPVYKCKVGGSGNEWEGTQTGYPDSDATQPLTANCLGSETGAENLQAACYGTISNNGCNLSILNANWSAWRLRTGDGNPNISATVFSVGFGPVDECPWANTTLKWVADAGGGLYYHSNNASRLREIYEEIAGSIISLSYDEQTAIITGNFSSTLFNDSYISYEYDIPSDTLITSGNVISLESAGFDNGVTSFNFSQGKILEAVATSYSGPKWTKTLTVNNSTGSPTTTVYNISKYGNNYMFLGDPFIINIPKNIPAINKENIVTLKIGADASELVNAGPYSKVIYTLHLKSNYTYSNVTSYAEGCNWTIEYYDGSNDTILSPEDYNGSNLCRYNSIYSSSNCIDTSTQNIIANDSIAQATYLLFKEYLDQNPKDCKIDLNLEDFYIDTIKVSSIPFLYYTTAEFLTWRK